MEILEALARTALPIAIKSLPVLLAAGMANRALRSARARSRHRLWIAALATLALLPILDLAGPRWETALRFGATEPSPEPAAVLSPGAKAPLGWSPASSKRSGTSARLAAPALGGRILRIAGGLYLLGVLAGLGRLAAGHLRVRGLWRRALQASSTDRRRLAALAGEPGAGPRIAFSEEVSVPFACGLLRPRVALPSAAATWSSERLRNTLIHELAHIERRDLWAQLGARLVCILYWCHPLVWWAERRLRLEAERACDERVVAAGAAAPEYAEQLIDQARGARSLGLVPSAGLARRSELPERIGALLEPAARTHRPILAAVLVGTLLGVGGAVATLHPSRAVAAGPLPALLEAAGNGNLARVRALIAEGAEVDQVVRGRGTALIRASAWGRLDVVEALLEAGADPNRIEGAGERPEGLKRSPLAAAASSGSAAIVERLIEAGAALDGAPEGDGTALMEAALRGHEGVVALLLEAGADPHRTVDGDGTALIAAVRSGSVAIVERLLAAGADPGVGVPGDGNPLIAAVERGDRRLVELLLAAGADPYAYVPGDETAVTRAAERGRRDLLELLVG